MTTYTQRQFVKDLRVALILGTEGCMLQQGADGRAWPCGTCVCHLLANIMNQRAPEYAAHNEPVDRINEVWRPILQIRDTAKRQ
jgi:hypothetical protein